MSTHYLARCDVKDSLVLGLMNAGMTIEPYLDESDDEMVELAYRNDVTDATSINANADGTIVSNSCRMYLLYWMYARIMEDKAGANQNDIAQDEKYMVKANYYMSRASFYEKKITGSEITGARSNSTDLISSQYMLRG